MFLKFRVEWGGRTLKLVRGSHGCGLWKNIRMRWDKFLLYIQFDIGLGNYIRFWHDDWCNEEPLRLVYLVLYDNSTNQENSVESQ